MNICAIYNIITFNFCCFLASAYTTLDRLYAVFFYIITVSIITACTVVQAVVLAMGLVNGKGRFSTPHSSETPGPIFMKLEIYNYFPDITPQAKFQGPMSTWVAWANSQFDQIKSNQIELFYSAPKKLTRELANLVCRT